MLNRVIESIITSGIIVCANRAVAHNMASNADLSRIVLVHFDFIAIRLSVGIFRIMLL